MRNSPGLEVVVNCPQQNKTHKRKWSKTTKRQATTARQASFQMSNWQGTLLKTWHHLQMLSTLRSGSELFWKSVWYYMPTKMKHQQGGSSAAASSRANQWWWLTFSNVESEVDFEVQVSLTKLLFLSLPKSFTFHMCRKTVFRSWRWDSVSLPGKNTRDLGSHTWFQSGKTEICCWMFSYLALTPQSSCSDYINHWISKTRWQKKKHWFLGSVYTSV